MDTDRPESTPAAEPAKAPIVLTYGDAVTQFGIVLLRRGERLRMVIPPVPGWRKLPHAYRSASLILSGILGMYAIMAIKANDVMFFIPAAGLFGTPLVIVFLVALYQLHRRVIIDLTADEMIIAVKVPTLSGSRRRFPRERISSISFNVSSRQLLVRVPGQEMTEYYISPDERVTHWVAETLTEELRRPMPVRSAADANEEEWEIIGPPPRQPSRKMLLTLWGIIAGTAAVICCFGMPWCVLGFYLFIFSGAPLGIALGTQEKEYYMF